MAMTRVGLRDSNKSLPADIRAAYVPGMHQGMQRLAGNMDTVQSSRGWGMGMGYLGDTCYDATGAAYDCALQDGTGPGVFATTDPTTDPLQTTSWYDPGNVMVSATVPKGATVIPPASTGGVDAAAITKIISAGASSIVPIIAATSQGVLYKVDPKTGAMTVYSQPAGNAQNLAIGGSVGTFSSPLGTASVAGFSGNTLVMIAALGLLAMFAMKK